MGESKNRASATGARPHGPRAGASTRDRPGIASFCQSQLSLRICGGRSGGAGPFGGLVVGGGWLHRPGVGLWPDGSNPRCLFPPCVLSSGEISRLERNAHYYKLMGRPELGLKEMEQAHQQNPDNLQIVNLLAQHYEDQGKFEAARQLYQEALTRHGSNPVLANNLGFSYYREGRLARG